GGRQRDRAADPPAAAAATAVVMVIPATIAARQRGGTCQGQCQRDADHTTCKPLHDLAPEPPGVHVLRRPAIPYCTAATAQ
ncbi:hypothetical protein NSP00_23265, partial [Salmonella enterica]|nr:hypothetical protein [Salmonella enterica]